MNREKPGFGSPPFQKAGKDFPAPVASAVRHGAVETAIARSHAYFRRTQYPAGYWWGELESNNTMEAEYIMLSYFLGRQDPEKWRKLTNYILSKQRDDGSWGQYYEAPGDLSTSVECYFALKLAGYSMDSGPLQKAKAFILSRGGVPGCRVFTKIWLAIFGQCGLEGHSQPAPGADAAAFVGALQHHTSFPAWARPTVVPLMLVLTYHPVCRVPEWANIDELFLQPRSEVDYSLPNPGLNLSNPFLLKSARDLLPFLLYRADQLMGLYRRIPNSPFPRDCGASGRGVGAFSPGT